MSNVSLEELARRVGELENEMKGLEERMKKREIVEAETKIALEGLRSEFISIKTDIMTSLTQHNNKTWKLIFILVALLAISFGISEGPTIVKSFLGGEVPLPNQ